MVRVSVPLRAHHAAFLCSARPVFPIPSSHYFFGLPISMIGTDLPFKRLRQTMHCAALLTLLGLHSHAHANCSRPIEVPLSPSGRSVTAAQDPTEGIYAELLRQFSKTENCQVVFNLVPRSRAEYIYANAGADILIPAIRTAERDKYGEFVPMIQGRAMMISAKEIKPKINSIKDLLNRKDLRVALVRGFDYGSEYLEMIKSLQQQGRLALEVDPLSVARRIKTGASQVTIMAPAVFYDYTINEARVSSLATTFKADFLAELNWSEAGAYLAHHRLPENDQALLKNYLTRIASSGELIKIYESYYPPAILKNNVRPLN